MKKLLLTLPLLAVSAFAWNCAVPEGSTPTKIKIPPTHFCMKIAAHETLLRYEEVSIKTGKRMTFDKDFHNIIIDAMNNNYIRCYETCLTDYTD